MITANNAGAQQQNPYEMSSGLLGGASDAFTGVVDGGVLQNINSYINPYYEQVLNSTLGRMDTNYQTGMDQIGDSAIASGAFGGSRHGVTEGVYTGEYNRNVGEVTSGIQRDAFNTATGLSQMDIQNQMQAGGAMQNLGGAYYDIGNNLTDRQGAAGATQQSFLQQLLSGGQGQFNDLLASPYQTIDLFDSLLSNDVRRGAGSQTSTSTPGMFDYLSLGAQVMGGGMLG